MDPTGAGHSAVLYTRQPYDDVEVGDVIVFEMPEEFAHGGEDTRGWMRFIVHRVANRTAEGLITKGDNKDDTDQAIGAPPVTKAMYRGTVIRWL